MTLFRPTVFFSSYISRSIISEDINPHQLSQSQETVVEPTHSRIMKNIFIFCIAVQIVLATIAVAQITFTREWVTGKRSLPPTRKVIVKEEHAWCSRSFVPVIEYLVEEERVRKHECGSHLNVNIPKSVSWIRPAIIDELPKTITVGNDDHLQYEVFNPKSS